MYWRQSLVWIWMWGDLRSVNSGEECTEPQRWKEQRVSWGSRFLLLMGIEVPDYIPIVLWQCTHLLISYPGRGPDNRVCETGCVDTWEDAWKLIEPPPYPGCRAAARRCEVTPRASTRRSCRWGLKPSPGSACRTGPGLFPPWEAPCSSLPQASRGLQICFLVFLNGAHLSWLNI